MRFRAFTVQELRTFNERRLVKLFRELKRQKRRFKNKIARLSLEIASLSEEEKRLEADIDPDGGGGGGGLSPLWRQLNDLESKLESYEYRLRRIQVRIRNVKGIYLEKQIDGDHDTLSGEVHVLSLSSHATV